jgi:tRNA nucleotidyltransferase (CCA-adding enzyme)
VESSSLKSDLNRRDFTINAMAVRIDSEDFGTLLDFFGGQRDLLDKKIRVLHSLSFIDDPSRAFRALRFAARLDFSLGANTEKLMKDAERLGVFAKIPGGRLFLEVKYILIENEYMAALLLLRKYNMLPFISPKLAINDSRMEQFERLDKIWERVGHLLDKKAKLCYVRYALLMADHNTAEFREVLNQFKIEEGLAEHLTDVHTKPRYAQKSLKGKGYKKPSEIYTLLMKLKDEELAMLAVLLGEGKQDIVIDFIEHHRLMRSSLTGNDLVALGVPHSALLGEILKELLAGRLDGELNTRQQEETYVRNRLKDIDQAL